MDRQLKQFTAKLVLKGPTILILFWWDVCPLLLHISQNKSLPGMENPRKKTLQDTGYKLKKNPVIVLSHNYKRFCFCQGKDIYKEMHLDVMLRTILGGGMHLHSGAQIRASLCLPLGIIWLENLWKKREVRSCGLKNITGRVCCVLRSKLWTVEKHRWETCSEIII